MNSKKQFKELKMLVKKHRITIYGIEKKSLQQKTNLTRQTISNLLNNEDGRHSNFCHLYNAIMAIEKEKLEAVYNND